MSSTSQPARSFFAYNGPGSQQGLRLQMVVTPEEVGA